MYSVAHIRIAAQGQTQAGLCVSFANDYPTSLSSLGTFLNAVILGQRK